MPTQKRHWIPSNSTQKYADKIRNLSLFYCCFAAGRVLSRLSTQELICALLGFDGVKGGKMTATTAQQPDKIGVQTAGKVVKCEKS